VALHDCSCVCFRAKRVPFLIIQIVPISARLCGTSSTADAASTTRRSFAGIPKALEQCDVGIVHVAGIVARSAVLKAIGKGPNEDMIAPSTTRPGPMWRQIEDPMTCADRCRALACYSPGFGLKLGFKPRPQALRGLCHATVTPVRLKDVDASVSF
jgi:hypothetical protein